MAFPLFPNQALKSTLGFPLIRFEDAVINLDPFTRVHPYETKEFIINDVLKHFQEVSFGEVLPGRGTSTLFVLVV